MKKILYLILTVCFISNLSAQIINFPDSNLKARLLLAASGNGIAYHNGNSFKIDSNNDNEIEVSEALLVNDLVLYNCGISNLSGLEYFINLTHLNCGNNTTNLTQELLTLILKVEICGYFILLLQYTFVTQFLFYLIH